MLNIKNGLIEDKTLGGVHFYQDLIPKSNTTSRPQNFMRPKGICIHNIGNKGTDAEDNTEYVDTTSKYVSWHLTVDHDSVAQELPFNENAWHAGDGIDGEGNRNYIAIEVADTMEAVRVAEKVVAELCEYFGFTRDNIKKHSDFKNTECPWLIGPIWNEFLGNIFKPKYRLLHTVTTDKTHEVTFEGFKKGMEIYVKETE